MKIAQSYDSSGPERRDRIRSGEVEAVHVSDPERA
jgi:hypothetical protein